MPQNNNTIVEIGKKLPTGSIKRIAIKTGKCEKTVWSFFKGHTVPTFENHMSMMDAAIEIMKELKNLESELSNLIE